MFKFTIREVVLVTAIVAAVLAWWLDHRQAAARLRELESANRIWQFRAEHLRGQLNGTKLGGKWLMPYRLEFDPDSEKVYTAKRKAGGEWVAGAGTVIEWRADWADLP
jgi:hypothetical protein